EHADLDARARVRAQPRTTDHVACRMAEGVGAEIAADLLEKGHGPHRPIGSAGLGGNERDRPASFPTPPLFLGPSLGKGTRDVERPALVDDRDRPPPVSDPRSIELSRRGAFHVLAGRVVLEGPHLDEILPLVPW